MTPEERFAADNQRLHKLLYPERPAHWVGDAVIFAAIAVAVRWSVVIAVSMIAAWLVTARIWYSHHKGRVAKQADAPDSSPGVSRREGSSPSSPTNGE